LAPSIKYNDAPTTLALSILSSQTAIILKESHGVLTAPQRVGGGKITVIDAVHLSTANVNIHFINILPPAPTAPNSPVPFKFSDRNFAAFTESR
jgi:hypothetical protein